MPARTPALLLSLLAVAATLIFAGCGEKSEPDVVVPVQPERTPDTRPDEDGGDRQDAETPAERRRAVREAIRGVLASGNPRLACDRYATKRLLRESFGGRTGCFEATSPRSAADSVRVFGITMRSEGLITATAIPKGGPSGGQRITVEVRMQAGDWRVDSLRSNVPVGP